MDRLRYRVHGPGTGRGPEGEGCYGIQLARSFLERQGIVARALAFRLGALVTLLLVAFAAVAPNNVQAQYITVSGDQFHDEHGDPFFPMIMNLYVDYFYQGTLDDFPTDPTLADVNTLRFGRSSLWSCTGYFNYPFNDGVDRLLQDLTEIKAQGFNTVRFLSNADKKFGEPGFKLKVKHSPTGQGGVAVDMDPPYVPDPATNPVLWFHFNSILAVCSLANTLDLKMIVEPTLGAPLIASYAGDETNLDHLAFLDAFAQFIAQNNVRNLMAYEFFGEPTFEDQGKGVYHTKADICELAHSWTSTVRSKDPHHMVTIGSVYHADVMYEGWDPMLLDIDFASIHVYPLVDEWEWAQDQATFLAAATDRFNNMFKFYDAYLRKPYVVTETGFSGEDPFEECSNTPNPLIGFPLTCWGDESDQNDFLEATFAGIRDSRCAGYGWWIFMNMHWLPEPNVITVDTIDLGSYKERYFGIMRFGDPVEPAPGTTGWEGSRKQAAQTLADWVQDPPAYAPFDPVPAVLDMNNRYFNQNMHPPNNITYDNPDVPGAPNQYGTLNGRVVDAATGEPIAGAVVFANNSTHKEVVPNGVDIYHIRAYVTYSDNDGRFSLRALDSQPGPGDNSGNPADVSGLSDWTIKDIKIAGHAAEQVHVLQHFEQDATYQLNSLQPRIDRVLSGEHVPLETTEHFDALASLSISTMHVEGTSDLKARYAVHLTPGFHASPTSHTHIYTEPVFFTCAEVFNADLKSNTPDRSFSTVTERKTHGELYLQFTLPVEEVRLEVRPNPTSDLITCTVRSTRTEAGALDYRLVDASGRKVLYGASAQLQFVIDLSGLAPGRYTLLVKDGTTILERTIIRQ